MLSRPRLFIAAVLAAASLFPIAAKASLLGDTAQIDYKVGNQNNLSAYGSSGQFTVPNMSTNILSNVIFAQLTATQFSLTFRGSLAFGSSIPFNGVVVTDFTKDFTGDLVTFDSSSTAVSGANVQVTIQGNQLLFNLNGLSFARDSVATFNIATEPSAPSAPLTPAGTPEPSSLILLGTGVLGAIGAGRRKLLAR